MSSSKKKPVTCSFCGKSQAEVKRIIAGPGVQICDACVGVCSAIIVRYDTKPVPPPPVLSKSADDAQKVLFLLRELKKEKIITESEYRSKARMLLAEDKKSKAAKK